MTGEFCDAFPSRREGVVGLAAIAAERLAPAAPSLYAGRVGFVDRSEKPPSTPTTSPRPTGTRAPRSSRLRRRDALLVDIGSTTTDIIDVAGRVAAIGYTDADRLATGN